MGSERSEDGKLMANILQATWRKWIGRGKREVQVKPKRAPHAARMRQLEIPAFDIAPHDPIMAYFLSTPGAVEVVGAARGREPNGGLLRLLAWQALPGSERAVRRRPATSPPWDSAPAA